MSRIYDQHTAAFANVSAYVIVKDGERVATIAFKYPRDGGGRLYAYVHWIGTEMVRGFAAGGGYDKHTAACNEAAFKMKPETWDMNHMTFVGALSKCDGYYWHDHLRKAGFSVLQAV